MIINDYKKNDVAHDNNMQDVTIRYNGLLAKSGADKVYAFYGYGNMWSTQGVQEMNRTVNGFEAVIPIRTNSNYINVAFKDSASNWDNNSNRNYSFAVDDVTSEIFFT